MSNLRPRLRSLFDLCPPHLAPFLRCGGDLIFGANSEISRGHRDPTVAQQQRNRIMNTPRTSVEHMFAKMGALGQNIANKRVMKVFQGPPLGPLFVCLAFFTNCHTCVEGSLTNIYFGSSPPALEHYLAGGVTPQDVGFF